jgi:RNA polymerase sigma-70 factor (ECF subfamily)
MPEGQEATGAGGHAFATTHWSVVMAAGDFDSSQAQNALETLCRTYWYPIYVYVRRKGYGPDDAEDLTQEFFAQLISKHHLRKADRTKGKFRNFLLGTLNNFLLREWDRAHRQKRGGRFILVSLDEPAPEQRYRLEPTDNDTPEKKFLRQWGMTVLKQALNALGRECDAEDKGALFREAQGLLSGERESGSYAELSARLQMTEGAARVAVHRLRQRYGELLRTEIAHTVDSAEEVDDEMHFLLSALSR